MTSISGPSAFDRTSRTSSNNKIPPHLRTEGFQSVLKGLGINQNDILSLSLLKGFQGDLELKEIQLLEINQQQTEVLNALGISNAHLAIVLNSEDEIDKIKNRLKKIKETCMDEESKELLSLAFGIDIAHDGTIFTDAAGGVVVIQTGLEEIESSL